MTDAPGSLPQLLDSLAGEVRGVFMRVERTDGTRIEGFFEHRRTPVAFSLLVATTQAVIEIPYDDVRRLWLPQAVKGRHLLYLSGATTLAVLIGVVSVQLTGSPALPGVLLGIATWMTVMLAAYLPPIHNWIVVWMLRYDASDRHAQ